MTQGSEVRNAAPIDKNVRLSNDLTLSKELTESVPPVKPEDTARNYFDNYLPNFNEPIERVAAKGLAKNAITHATAGMVSGKRIDSTVELAQLKLLEYSLKNP